MAAKLMPGYTSKLTQILEPTDRAIPLEDTQAVLNRLNEDGDWTTLLVVDTVGYEVIKVINHRGTLAVDRGLSGTVAKRFPVGACVMGTPSDELLKAIACETDCCEEDTTYGDSATSLNKVQLERLPTNIMGGIDAVLGEPNGFMMINGKRVPYWD